MFDTLAVFEQHGNAAPYTISVSYKEIYRDEVLDLLSADRSANRRSSREATLDYENAWLQPDGTRAFRVKSPEDMCMYKEHGDEMRKNSSRRLSCCSASLSHAVFSICINMLTTDKQSAVAQPFGQIHIVDLASSDASACLQERRHHAEEEAPSHEMVQAASSVDDSLRDLSNAVFLAAADDGSRACSEAPAPSHQEGHPLTCLVKYANVTVVLACVSCAHTACGEAHATLEFASRCIDLGGRPTPAPHADIVELDKKFSFSAAPVEEEREPAGGSVRGGALPPGDPVPAPECRPFPSIPCNQNTVTEAVERFREALRLHSTVLEDVSSVYQSAANPTKAPSHASPHPTPTAPPLPYKRPHTCAQADNPPKLPARPRARSLSAFLPNLPPLPDICGDRYAGWQGSEAGGVEMQRFITARQERLNHLAAVVEQERQVGYSSYTPAVTRGRIRPCLLPLAACWLQS